MLVFIDESGDPGFEVDKGSSPIFVAAMVIFPDAEAARRTEQLIRKIAAAHRVRPEFKFNKSSGRLRDAFFGAVQACPFRVRAIVVRKEVIYSARLRSSKEDFYRYFVRQMMAHDNGTLGGAKVVIDGSGDRVFRRRLAAALRRQLAGRLKDLKFSDSMSDPLVQLADMCAGAIARSYRKDRADAGRWRTMLAPRINDIWDFR
jgi:hypothetical protein